MKKTVARLTLRFSLLFICSLLNLFALSCTRKAEDVSHVKVNLQNSSGVSLLAAFPAGQKVCYAVEVQGAGIAASAPNTCTPVLGQFAGWKESGSIISLDVSQGDARKFRLFAQVKASGDNSACSDWNPTITDYSSVFLVGESQAIDLKTSEVNVSLTSVFPGLANSLLATQDLSTDCIAGLCIGTDHGGANWALANGEVVSGTHCNVGTFDIPSSITATVAPQTKFKVKAVTVTISGVLDASGAGYPAMTGPGAATSSNGGGGHASAGSGAGAGVAYDTIKTPSYFGSGGGIGAGGGYIEVNATNSITFIGYGGWLKARGAPGPSGGGGGGGTIILRSPTITTAAVSGGNIDAGGGSGNVSNAGGGGGGRIVIEGNFTGMVTATSSGGYGDGTSGSTSALNAGAGTIYKYATGASSGTLVYSSSYSNLQTISLANLTGYTAVDLGGTGAAVTVSNQSVTIPIDVNGGSLTATGTSSFSNVKVQNNGQFYAQGSTTVSTLNILGGLAKAQNTSTMSTVTATGGTFWATDSSNISTLSASGSAVIHSTHSTVLYGSVSLGSGSKMTHEGLQGPAAPLNGLYVNASSFTIDSGASIDVTGMGYGATAGPGGSSTPSVGGSYGGIGGGGGASPYGTSVNPTDFGSGGYGSNGNDIYYAQGAGGGLVRIRVTGTFVNNGSILADGYSMGCCITNSAGSGGSIFIAANVFDGNGLVQAAGGSPYSGSSGGGGRIAIYYNSKSFTGTLAAHGGTTGSPGGAGVMYEAGNGTFGSAPSL